MGWGNILRIVQEIVAGHNEELGTLCHKGIVVAFLERKSGKQEEEQV
jgi:hypothetical protein